MVVYEVIPFNNEVRNGLRRLSNDPSLADLQEAVGGYIEYLPTSMIQRVDGNGNDNIIEMIVNEEGMIHRLPVNQLATQLLHPSMPHPLVGNVVVVTPNGIAKVWPGLWWTMYGSEEE